MGRVLRRAALVALALAAISAPAALAGSLSGVASSLRSNPVYAEADAQHPLTAAQQADLRAQISASGAPIYVIVLPERALKAADGTPDGLLRAIQATTGLGGTYALLVGNRFLAGSTDLPTGEAPSLATQAFDAHRADGAYGVLQDFVRRIGAASSGSSGSGGSSAGGSSGLGSGGVLLGLLVIGGAAIGGYGLLAARRRRRRDAVRVAALKEVVGQDLAKLDDDVIALDAAYTPGRIPEADADYARATEGAERARALCDAAKRPEDLEPATAAAADARYSMSCVQARVEGRPVPERRAPCFFNPQHGPSVRDVTWTPPGAAARQVPACEACAREVEAGATRPVDTREIEVAGGSVPYWDAPGWYHPYGGGYYRGFVGSGGGFFEGMLLGSLLGGGGFGGGFGDGGGLGGGGGGDFGGGGGGGGGSW